MASRGIEAAACARSFPASFRPFSPSIFKQAAGELHPADDACRVELQRPPVERESGGGVGALRPAEQPADVVDHLGVERAERDMSIGVPGRECDRAFERRPDLAAEPVRQSVDDADPLAVAPERVAVPVPGVGVPRFGALLRLGACGGLEVERELCLGVPLEVMGVDTLRLVGRRHAGAAGLQTRVDGPRNSPAWNSVQAETTFSSSGHGSASPAWSRDHCFRAGRVVNEVGVVVRERRPTSP